MGPDLCPTVALTCFTTFFCRKRGKNRKKAAGEAHINFCTVGDSKEKSFKGDISMRKKLEDTPPLTAEAIMFERSTLKPSYMSFDLSW